MVIEFNTIFSQVPEGLKALTTVRLGALRVPEGTILPIGDLSLGLDFSAFIGRQLDVDLDADTLIIKQIRPSSPT